ncbi:uncharacterized protein LOC136081908 [Hydra vulgaris]|uniref:Uncharacterized protein LOC136081908 n=1 Tax=Hydra vulgaris TaxID=6087 RepID=A0ABM4C478_HYDVU
MYKLGVLLFILVIFNDYSFVANHNDTTCNISSLAVNKLKLIKTKSALFEAVRFLKNKESSLQSNILFEHLNAMRKVNVGEVLYTSEIICRAYEYFAMRRSLYDCLCIDYKLPSIRTLTRLTSKISSMEDLSFINSIFMNLNPLKRTSILLIDDVYVKASLLYQRGALFGQAVNYPEKLAKTILSFMIKCLFGGPEFICRAQPVANLPSEFQFSQCQQIVDTINNIENSKTLVIITDGNRVNQRFFGMFKTVDSKPWLTTSGIYFLYDYVHLLKSIRNNWLTEKTDELQFLNNKELALAK